MVTQLEFDFMKELPVGKLKYEDIVRMNNDKYDFCPYLRMIKNSEHKQITGLCALIPHKEFGKFKKCTGVPYKKIEGTGFAIDDCIIAKELYDKDK